MSHRVRDEVTGIRLAAIRHRREEWCIGLDEDQFLECCERSSDAARTDPLAAICLAALSRRYLADMRDGGGDTGDAEILDLTIQPG